MEKIISEMVEPEAEISSKSGGTRGTGGKRKSGGTRGTSGKHKTGGKHKSKHKTSGTRGTHGKHW